MSIAVLEARWEVKKKFSEAKQLPVNWAADRQYEDYSDNCTQYWLCYRITQASKVKLKPVYTFQVEWYHKWLDTLM